MTLNQSLRLLSITTALVVLPSQFASAQDATKFGEDLKAALTKQGLSAEWTNIEQNGSQLVLKGVSFGLPKGAAAATSQTKPIGDVTLDGVTEQAGGYKVEKVSFPTYSTTDQGITFDLSGVSLSGLEIPAAGETDPLKSLMLYDAADVGKVAFTSNGTEMFTLDNLNVKLDRGTEGAFGFTGKAEKFAANLGAIPDPKTKQVVEALGYQNIDGFLEMAGSWQVGSGALKISQYDLTVNDVGKLGFTFDIDGYTPAFIKSVQDLQQKMAAQPAGSDNSAQGLAMLGLMQQLKYGGMSIRFDDDSLTEKVIDYIAKQQGVQPSDITNQAKAIVPFGLAQLQMPDLAKQASDAVNAYLDDPKSLEIVSRPSAPVPVAQLAGSAAGNPLDVLKQLGLSVSANQAK
ncbi:hypothetical protein NGM99_13505 [Mesorhizobium sp. RP14(2022)]|uniref:DUF945 domain-containing protein n=1 Tax=Mesorhizobium liriopis TaxID=2953882 RepID=A0ABT1C9Z8_9HYPH|nr:hypothetical protein [Mesorhizobium liriopis]MCO6050796.1 hypothetical protein [Mesorhizobium liriopis]